MDTIGSLFVLFTICTISKSRKKGSFLKSSGKHSPIFISVFKEISAKSFTISAYLNL